MASDARASVHDIVERLQQLMGRPFWNVWRGVGSHLFFDAGEPLIQVAQRTTRSFEDAGHRVERRSADIQGSHGLNVEMAAWTVDYQGRQIAHAESSDKTFRELTSWFCGQSLVSAVSRGPTALDLEFDLGPRLALRQHEDPEDDDPLVTMWDEGGYISLLADGTVVEEGMRPPERI